MTGELDDPSCCQCGCFVDTDDKWSCCAPVRIKDQWWCAGCGLAIDINVKAFDSHDKEESETDVSDNLRGPAVGLQGTETT